MNRRIGIVLILIGVIGLGVASKFLFSPPVEQTVDMLNQTLEQPEEQTTPNEVVVEESEIEETDECPDIPLGIHRHDMSPVQPIKVNTTVQLDAKELFGIEEEGLAWSQLSPTPDGWMYRTYHSLTFSNINGTMVNVSAPYPGQYMIQLQGGQEQFIHYLSATQDDAPKLDVKGINFIDLFGETGGSEFNINPENPDCREEAFLHAFEGPERVNANYVGLVSAVFIDRVEPLEFGDGGNFLSLSDDEFYGAIISAAKNRGFMVSETLSDSPGLELSPEDSSLLGQRQQTPEYWDEFFTLWEAHVVERAERAESHGVEYFVPYLFADMTMRPEIYPEYDDRWVQIIHSIREVYTGEIGFSVINADDRLTFLDEIDVLQITVFGGLYTSREGAIADINNPTMDELVQITEDMTWYHDKLSENVSIQYVLTFASSDGQNTVEDPELRSPIDFAEQVLYYEAFFTAMNDEPWVSGIISERWDYWDDWRRTGDSPDAAYFDESTGSTPRNKPAEDVIALWFKMK